MKGTTQAGIWILSFLGYMSIVVFTYGLWKSTGGLDNTEGGYDWYKEAAFFWPVMLPVWVAIHKTVAFWIGSITLGVSLLGFEKVKTFFSFLKSKAYAWFYTSKHQKLIDVIECDSEMEDFVKEARKEVKQCLEG